MITNNKDYYNRKSIDDSGKLMFIGVMGFLLTILGMMLYKGLMFLLFFKYIYTYI